MPTTIAKFTVQTCAGEIDLNHDPRRQWAERARRRHPRRADVAERIDAAAESATAANLDHLGAP